MKNLFLNSHGGWSWIVYLIWSPATRKFSNCLNSNISIKASEISGDVLLASFTNLMTKQNGVDFCCWLMLDCCQTQFEAQPPRNLWPEPPSLKPLSSTPLLKGWNWCCWWNSNNLNLLNNQEINFSKLKE